MKLLFDENLSSRLPKKLAATFPGSSHADDVALHARPDIEIWNFAGEHDFLIVSKDNDFRQLSALYGAPPKVIWLHIGNASTGEIEALLLERRQRIQEFFEDMESALLVLDALPT